MDHFKNHVAPLIAFGGLGLYSLWYVVKSSVAWRRDGALGVRNRISWMPLGPAVSTALDVVRGDPTDKRPVHRLRNPAVIVLWLLVCVAFAGACFAGAYQFFRTGHGF